MATKTDTDAVMDPQTHDASTTSPVIPERYWECTVQHEMNTIERHFGKDRSLVLNFEAPTLEALHDKVAQALAGRRQDKKSHHRFIYDEVRLVEVLDRRTFDIDAMEAGPVWTGHLVRDERERLREEARLERMRVAAEAAREADERRKYEQLQAKYGSREKEGSVA
jgi:hypothetical protein